MRATWLFLALCGSVLAKDMTSLYSDKELARWQPALEKEAREILSSAVLPALNQQARAQVAAAAKEFPLRGDRADPFDFSASYLDKLITIPVLSLKWLHDLIAADAWLYCNGYRAISVELYINMLKYHPEASFVGQRYPQPLPTLGAPRGADGMAALDPLSDAHAKHSYRSALTFILGHEIAHYVLPHQVRLLENEREADVLALQILGRNIGDFFAVEKFFRYAGFWIANRSDFNSEPEYQAALFSSPHPLVGQRVLYAGVMLSQHSAGLFPGLTAGHSYLALTRQAGEKLISMAKTMDDLNTKAELKLIGTATRVEDLVPRNAPTTKLIAERCPPI